MTESDELMTIEEVARLCHVSKQTVRRAVKAGALRETKLSAQVRRYTQDDVRRWIDRGRGGGR